MTSHDLFRSIRTSYLDEGYLKFSHTKLMEIPCALNQKMKSQYIYMIYIYFKVNLINRVHDDLNKV